MKRFILGALLAAPLAAQQPAAAPAAAPADPSKVVVAEVNGDPITQGQLDVLWYRLSENMRDQYRKNAGGKRGLLQNYVAKRLIVQEAVAKGFDKRPEVQAELAATRESQLFDLYIRDVIAAPIVSEEQVRAFYDEHKTSEFVSPPRAKARHILVTTKNRTPVEARAIVAQLMSDLQPVRMQAATAGSLSAFTQKFADAAAKVSEDAATAKNGGDLGWVTADSIDPKLGDAIFNLKPGAMSGIVEANDGYHLIYVEEQEPQDIVPYELIRPAVREFLFSQNTAKVMDAVSKRSLELRSAGKVAIYPEKVQ
ncbi:MAG: peptidylprolyl isomerase [Acidobacteria bacterium]|nr:peptidylprolyl isomerase [Acidobacteriota bacterium]MBV9475993.1 peptidylprolyl isomerase [Acidobacteriota bacterium]